MQIEKITEKPLEIKFSLQKITKFVGEPTQTAYTNPKTTVIMVLNLERRLEVLTKIYREKRIKRTFVKFMKAMYYAAKRSAKDCFTVHAAALSYNTILAIVPVIAFVIALGRSIGLDSVIEQMLRDSMGEHQEALQIVLDTVDQYLAHLSGGAVLGVGIVVWVYSIVMIFREIERTLNDIWRTTSTRTIVAMVADYTAFVFVMFITILLVVGVTGKIATIDDYWASYDIVGITISGLVTMFHWVVVVLAFTGMYQFIPSERLHMSLCTSACCGMATSAVFLVTQYLVVHCQIFISTYNFSYGSLSVVPMALLWIYVTWLSFIFFGELAYVWRNYDLKHSHPGKTSPRLMKFHCIQIMLVICEGFKNGNKYYCFPELCEKTGLMIPHVRESIKMLQEGKFIVEAQLGIAQENGGMTQKLVYLPTRDSSNLRPSDLANLLDCVGNNKSPNPHWAEFNKIETEHYKNLK